MFYKTVWSNWEEFISLKIVVYLIAPTLPEQARALDKINQTMNMLNINSSLSPSKQTISY